MNPTTIAVLKTVIAKLFDDHPELSEDEDFRRDVLEGETDLHAVVGRLARESQALRAECAGLKEAATAFVARAGRKAERDRDVREAIKAILGAADLTKIKTHAASVSLANVAPSVIVTDEAAIPDQFMRVKRSPDLSAIKDALAAGENVPGAAMGNGGQALRIV